MRRQLIGCFYWPLSIMTLGVFNLLLSNAEKHFIRTMDDSGVETRGGKRIAWNEFTSIERVQGTMKGAVLSDEYLLKSPKGKVSLPTWRAENAQEAKEYLLRRVPPHLLQKGH